MKISYREQMKVKYDTKQVKFKKNGETTKEDISKHLNEFFLCPFCLYSDKLSKFVIYDTPFYMVCPECKLKMLARTLVTEMTIEQFARWVFNYGFSGFWTKCSFDKFNSRLKKMGIAIRFWGEYHRLKGLEQE